MARDKALQRAAAQRHYAQNKKKMKARAKVFRDAHRLKVRQYVIDQKDGQCCTDCGNRYPHYVLQYDHVRGVKIAAVADLVRRAAPLTRIVDEIAKCEIVCANCHATRTHCRLEELADSPGPEPGVILGSNPRPAA